MNDVKLCKSCGIILNENIRIQYNASLLCKYCYKYMSRADSRFYYHAHKTLAPKITKKCVVCGSKFETSRKNKIVCSQKCRKVHKCNTTKEKYIKKEPTSCIICGTQLDRARIKLCSDACRKIRKRQLEKMYQFKKKG